MNISESTDLSQADRGKGLILFELVLFLLIVGVGIASRFWLADLPNFKPVAAMALFSGFLFRKAWMPILSIGVIFLVSDLWLGGYEWQIALAVSASMVLAIGLGRLIRVVGSKAPTSSESRPSWFQGIQFLAASLTMSTFFFLSTNLAVWKFSGWYSVDLAGLTTCFAAAIPFYRWTIAGDLFFTGALFASYVICWSLIAQWNDQRHVNSTKAQPING